MSYKNKLIFMCVIINIFLLTLPNGIISYSTALDKAVKETNVNLVWSNDNIQGEGIIIGIVDTGIDWQHPDFYETAPKLVFQGGPWPSSNGVSDNLYIDLNNDGIYTDATLETTEGPIRLLDNGELNQSGEIISSVGDYDPGIDLFFIDQNNDGIYNSEPGSEEPIFKLYNDFSGILVQGLEIHLIDRTRSKIIKMWDMSTQRYYVRGVNLSSSLNTEKDYDGHGTHCASIAIGGKVNVGKFVGVAPKANLKIVKLPDWDNRTKISEGIKWLVNDGIDILSLSYGDYWKNLTLDGAGKSEGGSELEDTIEWVYQQGVIPIISAGNNGDKDAHATLQVPSQNSDSTDIVIPVQPKITSLDLTLLWKSPNSALDISIIDPNNIEISPKININATDGSWNVVSDSFPIFGNFYHVQWFSALHANSRGTNKTYIRIVCNPFPDNISTPSNDHNIHQFALNNTVVGNWKIKITNPSISSKIQDVQAYLVSNEEYISYVGHPGAYFLTPNRNMTISSPATADHAIVVGSYITSHSSSSKIGKISDFSSWGPRIDYVLPKMITAPGEAIMAAASKHANSNGNNYTQKSGTSMATPFIAGCCALALNANSSLKDNIDLVYEVIKRSARIDGNVSILGNLKNYAFGWGKINASALIDHSYSIKNICPTNPESPILSSMKSSIYLNECVWINWTTNPNTDNYTLYQYNSMIYEINESLTLIADEIRNSSFLYSPFTNGTFYFVILARNQTGVNMSNVIQIIIEPIPQENPDLVNPIWLETPTNQIITYGEKFYLDVNASDNIAIDKYWINDTINFQIDNVGIITNISTLIIGCYYLGIHVNDTSGNEIIATIRIKVIDNSTNNTSTETTTDTNTNTDSDDHSSIDNDSTTDDKQNYGIIGYQTEVIFAIIIAFSSSLVILKKKQI
ncbi:MAG: S8 family serine peptidase [Candidatus Lokiarchaeota archaeon]|nr:S8 family serine peptidase [Candidatus Harpocratesius repetitus]